MANRESLVISTVIALVGVGIIAGVLYANLTLDLAAEYEAFIGNCGELAGRSQFTDTGLGWSPSELNGSYVEACRNTTLSEYRLARTQSNRTTPFNLLQWTGYLGVGCLFLGGGLALIRHSLRADSGDEPEP